MTVLCRLTAANYFDPELARTRKFVIDRTSFLPRDATGIEDGVDMSLSKTALATFVPIRRRSSRTASCFFGRCWPLTSDSKPKKAVIAVIQTKEIILWRNVPMDLSLIASLGPFVRSVAV